MPKLLMAIIEKITAGKTFSDGNDERYLYLISAVVAVFAGTMHIFLLSAMIIMGVNLFIFLNIISILIYASLLLLVLTRRTYRLVSILTTVEVIAYASFASFYLGINCYFFLYFFLILLIHLNVPYAKTKTRIICSALILIAITASVVTSFYFEPLYQLPDSMVLALAVSNCILCFFGTLIELLAVNIIQKDNAERVRKYEERAHTDSLTGIYNRWYADGFISNFYELRKEKHWCVAMLDIDDFKNINDTMGHPAGDEVLRSLANIMNTSLRKTDVLFRWGGEEFLMFLSDVELETAAGILDTLRRNIADTPIFTANKKINYTVTIGVAAVDLNDVQSSISVCDERLYQGKQNGKNQVVS